MDKNTLKELRDHYDTTDTAESVETADWDGGGTPETPLTAWLPRRRAARGKKQKLRVVAGEGFEPS